MANISAQMVKELRDKTGAGMMDCKAALGETNGNMDQAVDWLRKIGENMTLRRAASLEVEQGVIANYVHNAVAEGLGKIGVLVALESSGKTDELARFGRMVAMHVAASNPLALDPSRLDPEL